MKLLYFNWKIWILNQLQSLMKLYMKGGYAEVMQLNIVIIFERAAEKGKKTTRRSPNCSSSPMQHVHRLFCKSKDGKIISSLDWILCCLSWIKADSNEKKWEFARESYVISIFQMVFRCSQYKSRKQKLKKLPSSKIHPNLSKLCTACWSATYLNFKMCINFGKSRNTTPFDGHLMPWWFHHCITSVIYKVRRVQQYNRFSRPSMPRLLQEVERHLLPLIIRI